MSKQNRVLSGIQPSGQLHIGNYFGMMSRMIRYQEEQFTGRDGDRAQAADWLEKLGSRALKAFDASTAAGTKRLAQKHRQAAT